MKKSPAILLRFPSFLGYMMLMGRIICILKFIFRNIAVHPTFLSILYSSKRLAVWVHQRFVRIWGYCYANHYCCLLYCVLGVLEELVSLYCAETPLAVFKDWDLINIHRRYVRKADPASDQEHKLTNFSYFLQALYFIIKITTRI